MQTLIKSFLASSILFVLLATEVRAGAHSQCQYQPKKQIFNIQSFLDLTNSEIFANLTPQEAYAMKLFIRLTGSPISIRSPRFRKAVKAVAANNYLEAGKIVTAEKNFLNVRVRNFAAPYSNKDFANTEAFNDLQALIVGVTRDELDARLILTGNIRYSGSSNLGLPPVSRANNDHYLRFEDGGYDMQTDLQFVEDQWEDLAVGSGAFTTRAWAKVNYDMGTNRRAVTNGLDYFMCGHKDSWKMRGLPDHFARRDVPRAPSEKPEDFQNDCRRCHSIMDGLGGAFAKLDFTNATLTYQADGVVPKMNQNGEVYKDGYVTVDDSWTSLMDMNPIVDMGFRSKTKGKGIQGYSQFLANSKAYSRCMVRRVYNEVCGTALVETAPALIETLSQDFENNKYNLKYLFTKVVTQNECVPFPTPEVQ